MADELRYTDRHGKPVKVHRIPMSTGKSKFKSKIAKCDNTQSVFDRFHSSNGSRHKSL